MKQDPKKMEITKFMKKSYKTESFVELIIKKQKAKKNDVGNG